MSPDLLIKKSDIFENGLHSVKIPWFTKNHGTGYQQLSGKMFFIDTEQAFPSKQC